MEIDVININSNIFGGTPIFNETRVPIEMLLT